MRRLDEIASQHALSVSLALRAIGLVSLCAFVSLHVQIAGLFGAHGIDPMALRLERLASQLESPMMQAPTLFGWFGGSDLAMSLTCIVGELASVAMIFAALGPIAPLIAYAAYLSFVSLGAPFLPLQWDTLLTESLIVAAIASPWTMRPVAFTKPHPPHPIALFALWLLVGRLMFAAGYVKLASGDDVWRDLTALDYHFETQPLPTRAGYLLHFGPAFLRRAGVVMTFVVELVLPFAIFFGQLGRRIAAMGFVSLMLLIAITGNYGFFDILALALTISLVDDAVFHRGMRRISFTSISTTHRARHAPAVLAGAQMLLALLTLFGTLGAGTYVPEAIDPFRVANHYGLFAVMTRERPIVVFEGSDDGVTWHEYDYRWQSGDPARPPAVCMPHMPRVDWMVWFAGLGGGEPEAWIVRTEIALLEARPDVLALFGSDPFHGRAPRLVRAIRYQYVFAPPGDRDWWSRSDGEPYGPTLRRE